MNVSVFFNAKVPPDVKRSAPLFIKLILSGLGPFKNVPGQVCLIFTGGAEIKKINRRFLKKDRITDVIAFNYKTDRQKGTPAKQAFFFEKEGQSPESAPFGDIFVCVDRAKRQAEKFEHPLFKELLILSVHGALHLAGMNDDTPKKRLKMQKKTEKTVGALKYQVEKSACRQCGK